MYHVFAPSTGRVIDNWSLKKSYRTFTADVTNAYFHVDEGEECYVDPLGPHWGIRLLCFGDCENNNCMAGHALEHAG